MSVSTSHSETGGTGTETKDPATQFERYDTIDTPRIAVVGVISAVLTFVIILSAQALFYASDRIEEKKKLSIQIPTPLTEAYTQQQNQLASYGWINTRKRVVNIPVAEAMRFVVEEHTQGAKAESK